MLNEKGYRYEEIWLPHDAAAKTLATKRSTIEQMLDAGFPCRKTPRLDVQDGIAAVRKILPTVRINQTHCFAGIEALRAYKRQYNELTKQFSVTPKHGLGIRRCRRIPLSLAGMPASRSEAPAHPSPRDANPPSFAKPESNVCRARDLFKPQ